MKFSTSLAVGFLSGAASGHLVTHSTATAMYLFPQFVFPSGPTRSICHRSNTFSVRSGKFSSLCFGGACLLQWSHCSTYCLMSSNNFGHQNQLEMTSKVAFIPWCPSWSWSSLRIINRSEVFSKTLSCFSFFRR